MKILHHQLTFVLVFVCFRDGALFFSLGWAGNPFLSAPQVLGIW